MRVKAKGITLIEVIVVISIVLLLAAISYPVFVSAKRQAKMTRSMSNMRQIHMAVMMYTDLELSAGPLGLGLPPNLTTVRKTQSLPIELFQTGGSGWKSPTGSALYTWMPPRLDVTENSPDLLDRWWDHMINTGNLPVILLDETYTPDTGLFSEKLGIGIYFDGHIEKRRTRGSLSRYDVWD